MKITDTPALKQWLLDHQALDLELRSHYHTLHQCPEVGSDLPLTKTYVCDTLRSFGCNPIETPEGGVVILLGSQDPDAPTLLLRADMDALPLKEETDLSFKSTNGSMHACGHDMHTSMMLGVTRLLKEEESTLNGRVKIIFQPHEEGLVGSKRMIENGILENPYVDAAIAIHVEADVEDCGIIRYRKAETTAASTIFEVTVHGKSAHGAQPHLGIDPLNVAVRIYLAFQELIARELSAFSSNILIVGMLNAGTSHNIIPEKATMRCSLRSFSNTDQTFIMKRVQEICDGIAGAFHAQASITILNSAPCTYNDPELTEELVNGARELFGEELKERPVPLPVSEDFSRFGQLVPSAFFTIATGGPDDGYHFTQHNPKVTFDENAMIRGCCFLHQCAIHWLNHQGKKSY